MKLTITKTWHYETNAQSWALAREEALEYSERVKPDEVEIKEEK